MKKPERIELYEKLYFHELDRRDKINERLSTPVGALVATTGIVTYLLNGNARISDQTYLVLFWLFLVAAVCALLAGGWYFRNAWFGHTDRHVATAAEIEDYHSKLEATYKDQPDAAALVDGHFEDFLLDTYRRSATTNATNNDQRSTALYYAGIWLTSAVVLSLLSTIPYYLGKAPENDREKAASSTSATATATASA
jgi:hypothetical protein